MRNKNHLIFIAAVFICFNLPACSAYRILGVFPMASKSHYFLGSAFMRALSDAGHDVTLISPYKSTQTPTGKWREIVLEDHERYLEERKQTMNMTQKFINFNPFEMIHLMTNMTVTLTEKTITHPDVQNLIHSGEKFDVVVVTEFMMDALKAFSYVFNAHLVGFTNSANMDWFYGNIGLHIPPSAYPGTMTPFPPQMSFFQRLPNTIITLFFKAAQKYIMYPHQQVLIDRYFPGSPKLEDIVKNVSLVIVNSHISLNSARPKLPNMIEVGGIHITPPKKLPSDLQSLLDNAKDGVIYFSMGSHLNSADLPLEKLDAILKTFSKRKELVLWKYAKDSLPNKPNNVVLGKWFPQQEILAHPNVKLFVTHSGFLSTTETIYHGVPIVGVPLMGDQKMNAKEAANAGYAIPVFVDDLTEDTFGRAVEEVISNPKYRENVVKRSKLFHDRQRTPAEEAVYWIEYIIRHNGAHHLRVPYLNLKWYEYYLLDVFVFIITVLLIVLYLLKKFFGYLIRRCTIRPPKLKSS